MWSVSGCGPDEGFRSARATWKSDARFRRKTNESHQICSFPAERNPVYFMDNTRVCCHLDAGKYGILLICPGLFWVRVARSRVSPRLRHLSRKAGAGAPSSPFISRAPSTQSKSRWRPSRYASRRSRPAPLATSPHDARAVMRVPSARDAKNPNKRSDRCATFVPPRRAGCLAGARP